MISTRSLIYWWGKWVTSIAVFIPLSYATTRWAWALGIPPGITEELLRGGPGQWHMAGRCCSYHGQRGMSHGLDEIRREIAPLVDR